MENYSKLLMESDKLRSTQLATNMKCRRRSSCSKFFYIKLRNLIIAHQGTYRKIMDNSIDESKKINLRKRLHLFDSQIQKLMLEKQSRSEIDESDIFLSSSASSSTSSSSYFHFRKNDVYGCLEEDKTFLPVMTSMTNVAKKGSQDNFEETKFIMKKIVKFPQTNRNELNYSQINMEMKKGVDFCKFIETCDEELLNETEEIKSELIVTETPPDSEPETSIKQNDDVNDNSGCNEQSVSTIINKSYEDTKKVEFFNAIGLITKTEFNELNNKKNSRKRRTTANPHFSHAALEAKRQTKLEMKAERKNRRQVSKQLENLGGSKSRNAFKTKRNGSSSLKQNNENRIPNAIKVTHMGEDRSKNFVKLDPKQLYPDLYLVKKITNAKYFCKKCLEICQCTNDSVIVCKRCKSFFHLTCAVPKKMFTKIFQLFCPSCHDQKDQEPNETDETDERASLTKELNELNKSINSLDNANQILFMLCKRREIQKNDLLQKKNRPMLYSANRLKECLAKFNYETENDQLPAIKMDTDSVEQTIDSSDYGCASSSASSSINRSETNSLNGDNNQLDSFFNPVDDSTEQNETSNTTINKCDTKGNGLHSVLASFYV